MTERLSGRFTEITMLPIFGKERMEFYAWLEFLPKREKEAVFEALVRLKIIKREEP